MKDLGLLQERPIMNRLRNGAITLQGSYLQPTTLITEYGYDGIQSRRFVEEHPYEVDTDIDLNQEIDT